MKTLPSLEFGYVYQLERAKIKLHKWVDAACDYHQHDLQVTSLMATYAIAAKCGDVAKELGI